MNELKRVVSPGFIAILTALLILNALIIINQNRSGAEGAAVYDTILKISLGYKTEYNTYRECVVSAWKDYLEQNGTDPKDITDEQKRARALALKKADYVDGYEASLRERIGNATGIIDAGIYEGFEKLNILKSRYDLYRLRDTKICPSNGIWLEKYFEYGFAHIFVILLLAVTVYSFFAERKNGLCHIIRTGVNGRLHLMLIRSGILIAQALVLSILFNLETSAVLLKIYKGIEGINDPAACDEVFILTAGNLSRLQFVCMATLFSALCAAALAVLLWFVLSLLGNVNVGIFVYLILCGSQILIYGIFSPKTVMRFLHYINAYYLIRPFKALEYDNWGYSYGIMTVAAGTALLAALTILICMAANAFFTLRRYYSRGSDPIEKYMIKISELFMRLMSRMPAAVMEVYKILISQRSLIILAALLFAVSGINVGNGAVYDLRTSYMLGYYNSAAGLSYGDELKGILAEWESEYDEFLEEADLEDPGSAKQIEYRTGIIEEVRNSVENIRRQNEAGIPAVVVNPYEYNDIFGSRQKENQMLMGLINVLAVIVISAGFMSYENKSGMRHIAMAARNRRRWLGKKLLVNTGFIAAFTVISYAIYYNRISQEYKFELLYAPLASLEMFADYPFRVSIIGFMIVDIIIRIVLLSALSVLVDALSSGLGYIYCVLAGLLFTLPQFLYMLGFGGLDKLSIGSAAAFLPLFNSGEAGRTAYCVFYAAAAACSGALIARAAVRST